MIYKPTKGSILSNEQAQRYGEAIAVLVEDGGGQVSPEIIVTDAQDEHSQLHDFFTWDDEEAARKYRLDQAHYLLRNIKVVVKKDEQEVELRAFHNVIVKTIEDQEHAQRTYVQIDRVLSEEDLYRQILDQAIKALNSWKQKYQQYKEFSGVIHAIDALQALD